MPYLLRLGLGPIVFALFLSFPLALQYQGRIALATFAWAITWWITQPAPWSVSALLPMLVFPFTGIMAIRPTIGLYGQPIFFWIMATVLLGYALEKHGLAKRIAYTLLSLPGVSHRLPVLLIAHMLGTGFISMFVSDAATIAIMTPIGLSLVRHVQLASGGEAKRGTALGALVSLGTFYAAVAGGTGSILGLPHNAIAISLAEELGKRSITFFSWMAVGVPLFLVLVATFYTTVRVMIPTGIDRLPSSDELLHHERAKLGGFGAAELRTLFVFVIVVFLFCLPSFVGLVMGPLHPTTERVSDALDTWVMPPIILFLLFLIPSGKGEGLLSWKEDQRQVPWDAMMLCAGAVAMVDAMTRFGFVDYIAGLVNSLGLGRVALTYAAAFITAWSTDFMSGTAAMTLYGSIFIPAAQAVGHNPASMSMMIANVALGLTFPWAGAAAATAFAVGDVDMKTMMKVGIVATMLFAAVAATIHLLLGHLV